MKKTLFPALAAALVLAACGTKTTGQAEVAAEAAAQQVVSSDIAYVQVEAVLAQCDLDKTEGVATQEKTEKAQKSGTQREQKPPQRGGDSVCGGIKIKLVSAAYACFGNAEEFARSFGFIGIVKTA